MEVLPLNNDLKDNIDCLICNTMPAVFYKKISGINYYECSHCTTLFADPAFLEKVDTHKINNYEEEYWKNEMSAARERSFGSSLQRVAEVFLYSRIPIKKFIDIGSGPGFLLDALKVVLPASEKTFYASELFPPSEKYRTKHLNYCIGTVGDIPFKFDAGTCIEVIEHLTPTILDSMIEQLAKKSNENAIFYFGSGQPFYVKNEDPEYLDPLERGHIVSYSLKGLSKIFNKHGFNIIPLPGRDWAFLAEFGTKAVPNADELLNRIWTALPENIGILKDPIFGPLMHTMGIESARCYLESAISIYYKNLIFNDPNKLGTASHRVSMYKNKLHEIAYNYCRKIGLLRR